MSSVDFLVVLITVPDAVVAERLSNKLMETKSAACVNIISDVRSIFSWQGGLSTEDELLLIVKTRTSFFEERIVPLVEEHHPYEVPEIIALPILKGSKPYLAWMEAETG